MASANVNILPTQGWVQVAPGNKFIRIRAFPDKYVYYVTSGANLPAATEMGYRVDCKDFWVNVTTTDNYYVRTVNPAPNQPTGLRLDIFYLT